MKIATLWHNPAAGDDGQSEKELIALIEQNGFQCRTIDEQDEALKSHLAHSDFLVIAGGDGTVRGAVKKLIMPGFDPVSVPVAVLPAGTANNIGTSLHIRGSQEEIITSWQDASPKPVDVGCGVSAQTSYFFLESLGIGLFPKLMEVMKHKEEEENREDRLDDALETLQQLIPSFPAFHCTIRIHGRTIEGRFLMVAVMNMPMFGPNLYMAPNADPGDGKLNLLLVSESEREHLAGFVAKRLAGIDVPFIGQSYLIDSVYLAWKQADAHVDDEVLPQAQVSQLDISAKPGLLTFLVPE
ncbi:diacylglycerol/lipid kinase family protein [Arsenicibacter rosenii]|uniref:DAGKc domain-containing protein n=1 Tax=Arsenicibacter rosenii TaxID=1750698 RepID=A0A1S2VA75_9BACT|nr:diacylglycerol kinase family protein [Arsenicibacter rosenii]OIN55569.1 hypothetical protein BLX24_29450 [Arsenicibacter rosenii]